ncbi:DMT family transporter [Martelella limonii]|uniref:DMT family transporter n=1 Tax=Martelella limonii TaxID=1647649 RepID=UPI0015808C3B|nr:DMT family transporter [Martelella limonii]
MEKHRIATGQLSGIFLITAAVLLLSLSDAVVKLSGARYGLAQLILLRSLGACLLLFVVARLWRHEIITRAPLWVTLRSLSLVAMWLFYYAALPMLSFALAAACFYTSPLWMALLSRLILKQPLGRTRTVAVFLGVAGVFLAVNPFVQAPTFWVLLPLAAAFCYALAAVITWQKCRDEGAFAMAFNLNVLLTIAAAALIAGLAMVGVDAPGSFVFSLWPVLAARDWAVLGMLAVFMVIIATSVAGAYRLAPAPVIGLFDNAYLVFAAIWGVVFFDQFPGPVELAGMMLILSGAALAALAPPAR